MKVPLTTRFPLPDVGKGRPLLLASLVTVLVATVAIVAAGMVMDRYMLPGVVLALWVAVWFAIRPQAAIIALGLVFLLLDHWISDEWLPRQMIWLPDITLLAFAARVVVLASTKRIKYRPPLALVGAIAVLALICVVSAVLQQPPLADVILGLRAYLRWPLIFLLSLLVGLDSKTMKWFVLAMAAMAIVQLPVTAYQWSQTKVAVDSIVGTFAVNCSTEMFMLCTYMLIVLTSLALHHRGYKAVLWAVAGALVCLPPLFGYVRISIFVTPAIIVGLAIWALLPRVGVKNWRRVGLVTLAVVIVLAIGVGAVRPVRSALEKNQSSIAGSGGVWREATAHKGTAKGKLYSIRAAHLAIDDSLATWVLGLGVGFSTSDELLASESAGDAAIEPTRTQVTATLLDIGYLGILALVAVYVTVFITLPRLRGDPDKFWVAMGWAVPLCVIVAVGALPYFAEWTSARATPVIFWTLVLAVYLRDQERRNSGHLSGETADVR